MTIKPVADLYLITYEDGRPYKYTHEAGEAIDAIGAGFKVEEFVSLDNHRAAMLHAGNSPSTPDGSVPLLRRWLAFGRGMQKAGSQLPRNLIAETEVMLEAAPQQEVKP
ncbi:hypothetical protein [Citrobacter werkmanii]|uniref:hypothetical protein n=1 Tax=Citrobacter werkmanii TaxID=67827 RepID=UPI0025511DDC|nr:hypothetical protein [Citrobacter werkmanii]